MQKFLKLKNFGNIKVMVASALFAAISIILGKFLAISVGDTLRFSFENLTIILSGMLFGPTVGASTGLIADIVGCILRGYAINPVLTFAAVFIGFTSGAVCYILKNFNNHIRILWVIIICHFIGSVFIKTIGLCLWYGYPFSVMFIERLINYIIVGTAEFIILEIITKNKTLMRTLGDNNEL